MSRLMGQTVEEFNERRRVAATVTAKTRKRCPGCSKMVEAGAAAVLTDDRDAEWHTGRMSGELRPIITGAWHLWHPECRAAFDAAKANLEGPR